MKNFVRPALAGAGGAAVIILAVWLLSLPAVIAFADAHNGLAAWVQAIFSVAAIVGTWAVAERQAHHARRLRDEEDTARATLAVAAERRRVEGVRAIAIAYADLAVERLISSEKILATDPSIADGEAVVRDVAYTRQLLLDFRISELDSGRAMLIFSAFAGLLGSLAASLQRQVDLANKHPHGWLPAFGEGMLVDVQTTLVVCRQRHGDLERLFNDIRAAEEFHEVNG
jgi:hypothetical protein